MKLFSVTAIATIAASFVAVTAASATTTALNKGWYEEDIQFLTAKPGAGGTCPDQPGLAFSRHVFYPGPNALGYMTVTAVSADHGGPGILISTLNTSGPTHGKTPPAGAKKWGTAAAPITGKSIFTRVTGAPISSTFSFFTTFILASPASDAGTGTLKILSGDGTNDGCVETFNFEKVFTGLN